MTNFAWVLAGAVVAGAGGAATNLAFCAALGERNPHNLRVMIAGGAVFAALTGGLLSVGRGGRVGTVARLFHVAAGTAFVGLLVFSCYFVGVWLPALGGGLAALAALWTILWLCGVRAR